MSFLPITMILVRNIFFMTVLSYFVAHSIYMKHKNKLKMPFVLIIALVRHNFDFIALDFFKILKLSKNFITDFS